MRTLTLTLHETGAANLDYLIERLGSKSTDEHTRRIDRDVIIEHAIVQAADAWRELEEKPEPGAPAAGN